MSGIYQLRKLGLTQALTENCIVRLSKRKELEFLPGGAVVPVAVPAMHKIPPYNS